MCLENQLDHYEAALIKIHQSLCSQWRYNVREGRGPGTRSCTAHKRKRVEDADLPKDISRLATGYVVRVAGLPTKAFTAQHMSDLAAAKAWLQQCNTDPTQLPDRKIKRVSDTDDDLPLGAYRCSTAKLTYYQVNIRGFPLRSFNVSSRRSDLEAKNLILAHRHMLLSEIAFDPNANKNGVVVPLIGDGPRRPYDLSGRPPHERNGGPLPQGMSRYRHGYMAVGADSKKRYFVSKRKSDDELFAAALAVAGK